MPLLSSSDLAELSGLAGDLAFHDPYTIQRWVNLTQDAQGNWQKGWVEIEAGMGSLQSWDLMAIEDLVGDRITSQTMAQVLLPLESVVTPKDRVNISGQVLEVQGVSPISALSMWLTVQTDRAILS